MVFIQSQVARQWQRALALVHRRECPGDFALAAAVRACEARWQQFLVRIETARPGDSVVSFGNWKGGPTVHLRKKHQKNGYNFLCL